MKKQKLVFRVVLVALLTMGSLVSMKAQMFYHNSHLFLGEKPTAWETLSTGPGIYMGSGFGLEFYENGLNFWRPYPNTNPGNYKLFIDATGKVGINRKPTTYALEVNGQVWTTAGLLITSDQRLKRNIVNISDNTSDYLEKLKNLNGKSYEKLVYNNKTNSEEIAEMVAQGKIRQEDASAALQSLNQTKKEVYKKEFGFIAQEVKTVFPELVEESADGISAVNYTGLIPILLEAIKELQAKVETLESQSTLQVSALATRSSVATANETINASTAYLSQNIPNPVNGTAQINYSLPEGTTSASISFYSMNGTIIKSIPLNVQERSGSISISSADFTSGLHIYRLIANGIVLGSKKMINQ